MADDVMKFPDTWEEFEEYFGFHDCKQAYMFGNTRLIPSFRVQQWLNHLDDVKRKEQLQENKMEQIAKMFGKKLGEEFNARKKGAKVGNQVMFSLIGVVYVDVPEDSQNWLLTGLLTGEYEIVKD